MRRIHSNDGFALLVTITLLAFLVLLLVSLATLTRVETRVADNARQTDSARQNAEMALTIALGQLQRLAGPDQRATATADLNASGQGGTHAWTGVWGNKNESGDYVSTPQLLGWLVSGNEPNTFSASTAAADFGRITAADTPSFSPTGTIGWGSADALGARASDLQINGQPARLLVGPGTVSPNPGNHEDYVVAPLKEVQVPANAIPGLSGTAPTTVARYAWWVGDEGVKARFNLADPRTDLPAPATQDRFDRLLIAQRHGIELVTKDGNSVFGDALYSAEDTGSAAVQFRKELRSVLDYAQIPMLDGFSAPDVLTALPLRRRDLTTWSRGILADQLRGGLRHDLTALFDTPSSAWTGTLKTSLDNASGFDHDNKRRIANFEDTRLYNDSDYSMHSGTGPDNRSPLAATWEQLQSFYQYAQNNTGVVDVTPQTDNQMAVSPIVQRFGVAFDASCATDGSNGLLHFFPQVVLWNPYNATLRGGYRVRFEFPGDGNDTTAKFLYFLTHDTVDDGEGNPIPILDDYPIYYHERIIPPPATPNSGKRSNYTMQFSIPTVEIPPGQAWVFTAYPGKAGTYQRTGDNWLANTYNTTASFTRPITYTFTPGQMADTALALGNKSGGAGGILPFHLLDASGDHELQLIDGPGLNGITVAPNNDGTATRATTTTDYQRARLNEFRDISAGTPSAVNQVGVFAVNSHQQINGRYNWLANYNQRSTSVGRAWFEWSQGFGAVPNWGSGNANTGDSSVWGIPLISSSPARTYTGPSRLTDGVGEAILFYLPRTDAPLLTLGQLQHASLAFGSNGQEPSYPFGNSYADPRIAQNRLVNPNTATTSSGPNEAHMLDVSYLLNHALWDRFFFSGRPDVTATQLQARIDARDPLPDARLRWLDNTEAADAMDFDRAASRLLSDGAFNVNSTSVEAWTALFASLRGVRVNPASGGAGSMSDTPYVRTPYAPGGANSSSLTDRWTGYRTLTDAQVRDLAVAMVDEVKTRGPFLSLADFVNRRLTDYPDATGLSGALQSAIDRVAGINRTILDSNIPDAGDTYPGPTGNGETWSAGGTPNDYYLQNFRAPRRAGTDKQRAKSAMAPGFLSQADMLSALGSGLSARSDTFVIRAYGETVNPLLTPADAGYITSRAWCEAVVQRLPEYVDKVGNAAEVQPVTGSTVNLTPENQSFGRRFKIVSFRWLSPEDI